jgi:hypothetical protein
LTCTDSYVVSPLAHDAGDVFVHVDRTIGAFHAQVISSEDPTALVRWLGDNGFALQPADASRFVPYVQRGWVFTTMRPDTTNPANHMPPGGWNVDVEPVEMRWTATDFEVPLPLLGIGASPSGRIAFDVVDAHRAALAGFETYYANHLDDAEMAAFERLYPALARFLGPGRWLTSLQTWDWDPRAESGIPLQAAPNDDEFLPLGTRWGGLGADAGLLAAGLLFARWRLHRRRQGPRGAR